MKALAAILAFFILLPYCCAQTKTAHPAPPPKTDPDQLGLTCAQILKMTSSDWVAYFNQKSGQDTPQNSANVIRATTVYGKCYDERTKRLAATLGKNGKGPLMGANGNFRDFEAALHDFTTKALAATNSAPDSPKAAYAPLYEKQFRYQFYESYVEKDLLSRPLTPEESDGYTKAKNHFGEVLGLLPDEKLHSVHSAFRQIFDVGPVSDITKLELYRFAIFILAPAKDKPFSPPPF
jgi:hypothetical protein